ncbi:MAG: cysteine synthase [Thermodesulfobacteria bacterium]|nr:cysteine synthase [Thermodesulfobacteriota bacterium]
MQVSHSILAKIGNTPIIKLRKLKVKPSVEIWVKIESFNPGGSIKDRPALFMIEEAEKSGLLTPEKIVIEASSGNTGIGLALVCAVKGYKCMIAISESASIERRKILKAYGAELLLTPASKGTDGAIEAVYDLLRSYPDKYFCPDQYNNPANWKSHYFTTAPEILRDTEGKITHVVCGLGTTGTAMGIARFFKDKKLPVQVIGVEPNPGHKIQGLKNMKESYPPGIYDKKLLSKIINVEDEEAFYWTRWLAKNEGIFAGISSGAALAGAIKLAETIDSGFIVVILPDGGERYLSTPLWSFSEKEKKAVLILTNTFSGKKEPFEPKDKKATIYTCGPTLNTPPHLGVYRRLLTIDILKRFLKLLGFDVFHIVNLTDFDDKTISTALEKKLSLKDLTQEVEKVFYEDLEFLKIKKADLYPKVSEHLEEMKELALKLFEKNKAYVKFSTMYFDISRFSDYGKLSKIDINKLKPGATIDLESYDKDEPFDFALLKRVSLLELKNGYFVETEFGKVKPTWHIHCAGILYKYFKGEVDLFTSGQELIFPHHENTRAVIKALTGKEPAKCWIHTGLCFYQGKKLEAETELTLKNLRKEKKFTGRELRLYFLKTHYKNPFNFTWKGLEEAQKTLKKLDKYIALIWISPEKDTPNTSKIISTITEFKSAWKKALKEDLNTPVAISELITFFKKLYPFLKEGISSKLKDEIFDALKEFNEVFEVLKLKIKKDVPAEITEKVKIREKARKEKDYELADKIRTELENSGYFVFDLPSGTKVVSFEK